jgi:TetR/AcrR family transcriptional regulator, tetracycline repressor protein
LNFNAVEECGTLVPDRKGDVREAPVRLTREHVLVVALDVLDEAGLDRLTMRRLSAALGVENGATYWHFRSKQELLEHMADALLAGVVPELPADGPWDEAVVTLARGLRRALLSRRDGARLFSGRFFPLPNALAYGEALVGLLTRAGLDPRSAAWAGDTLTFYVVAHVTEEQVARALPDGGQEARARLDTGLDPARHPHLVAAREDIAAADPDQHFEHGLALVLAGIRATVGQQPSRRAAR